jgi:uncharacterized membrane protein
MSDRLTLAASTGLPFLLLAFHVAAGTVGFLSGSVAIVARKGGQWHRRSGLIFVVTMIAMGVSAVGISVYEGKESVAGGGLAAYLIFTAWTAIRPLPGAGRSADIALMCFALFLAVGGFAQAITVFGMPGHQDEGVPAGMYFFLASANLLAAIGDGRMIWAGGIHGTRRLARHLWRMCFGLFIAMGSFIAQFVRMTFIPDWMRSLPVILTLSVGPLILLLYWMWRVRWRQNLRGLITAKPIAVNA